MAISYWLMAVGLSEKQAKVKMLFAVRFSKMINFDPLNLLNIIFCKIDGSLRIIDNSIFIVVRRKHFKYWLKTSMVRLFSHLYKRGGLLIL